MTGTPRLDDRGLPVGYPFKPDLEITPREARSRLAQAGLLLVDVRTGPEWNISHIPGAIHIPLDELPGRITEIDDGRPLAFLCHHGVRSLKAALYSRENGCPDALSVAGGIDLWSRSADAAIPLYDRGPSGCHLLPPPGKAP